MRRLTSEAYFKKLVLSKISEHFYYHNNIDCGNQMGVPDTFVEGISDDLWIEFKILKKTHGSVVVSTLTSSHQKIWFNRRLAIKKDVLLVIGFMSKGKILLYHTQDCTDPIIRDDLIKNGMSIDDFIAYLKDRLS